MKRLILLIALLILLPVPVQADAVEYTAPTVPQEGAAYMPQERTSFGSALWELAGKVLAELRPDLRAAASSCLGVFAGVLAASILALIPGDTKRAVQMTLTLAVSAALLGTTQTMVRLGADTVREMSDYGKLLFPVMTAAMAAQGGVSASAALYTGTTIFDTLLSSLIASLLVPLVYLFLAFAVANSAVGEGALKKLRDLVKNALSWCLKTVLTVFTAYMSITGVVSGATDAATLKATKMTISSVVPVVGGILSDASEAVLISAGVMKSAAGVYGILAILAVFLSPFLRLGVQYFVLKGTAAVCGVFAAGPATELIEDFSTAMGLLLGMTGAAAVMLLISTACFLRGVG